MKHNVKKVLALVLVLLFALCACAPKAPADGDVPSPSPSAQPTAPAQPAMEPGSGADVNLAVLSGPTGVGAAKLLADSDNGQSVNRYHYTICTDNAEVTAGLLNGDFDIAAIATNVASNLYHKSNGGVRMLAVNTLGVLYILGPADAPIDSLDQLAGKTLYATGQGANPEYVLHYLLEQNGVSAGDVDIVWGSADEVNVAMLQGDGAYCLLPVPAATALEVKSQGKITAQISLSDEWDALYNGSQLTMGCVVARAGFIEENPEAVNLFLREYYASITYMNDPVNMAVSSDLNPAELVAGYGIAPNAAIAGKAIPQCNLTFLTGIAMRDTVLGYYDVLCDADPASVGGSIPDDAFFFIPDGNYWIGA